MKDAKIIVRSYNRPELIKELTLSTLKSQKDIDLSEMLYVVVHETQIKMYEEALKDFPIKDFIVKKVKGIHESVKAAHEYFPEGEKLFFLDDDVPPITHYTGTPSKETQEEMTCLGKYMEDAFTTLEKINGGSWTVKFMSNLMWMANKPWKQYRPHHMAGNFWGAYNSPLILTPFGHDEDRLRASRFIENYGGTLVYNWLSCKDNDKIRPGGMADSGDRGKDDNVKRTELICKQIYAEDALYRKYHNPPELNESWGFWSVKLKPLSVIQRIRSCDMYSWEEFFTEEYTMKKGRDLSVENAFDSMFGGFEDE